MADVTAIVLTDAAETPVGGTPAATNRTFNPKVVSKDLVTYRNDAELTYLGQPELTLGNRVPTGTNGNYKASMRLKLPVLEVLSAGVNGITPGPTLAYTLTANLDVIIPSRATYDERYDLAAMLADAINETAVKGLIRDMDLPH
jgi:hypothetical protein